MSNRSHATTNTAVAAWSERSGCGGGGGGGEAEVFRLELDVSGGDKADVDRAVKAGAMAVRLEECGCITEEGLGGY